MKWAQKQNGFTIVELLIVVVVIAILAAITIVSYNGIQNRAKDSAAQLAATQIGKKLTQYAVDNGDSYPADKTAFLSYVGLAEVGDTTFEYQASPDQKRICASSTKKDISYAFLSATGGTQKGRCVLNLIPNSDFEASSAGWYGTNVNFVQDSTISNSGNASMRFRHTGAATDG